MINRTACDVLEAMRQCDKTRNYSYLLGLVEELQNICYRMEAGLWDQKEFKAMERRHKKLKKEVKAMEEKLED